MCTLFRQRLCKLIIVAATVFPIFAWGDAATLPQVKESGMESSKRRAPAAKPVTHKGIRYEQLRAARSRGFGQSGGVIAAVDEASGQELWTLQLYTTQYDPHEETDAQEVYIEELRIDKKSETLIARDERGRTFIVNLKDRTVTETH
jgi:hypothetical protein